MSVSDTEVSDVTWTDNGTFNLSEGHTPQTENSEGKFHLTLFFLMLRATLCLAYLGNWCFFLFVSGPLWSDFDREEPFIGGLPEFPSLDNGTTTNGDDDEDLSLGLASPPTRLQDPIKSKHEPQDQSTNALDLVNQMAGEVITAAVTAAIQERIEAAVSFMTPTEDPKRAGLTESSRLLELTEESDSEVEDFELLDQSELEQLEGELGLGEKAKAKEEVQTDNPASSGFLSKLLKRHWRMKSLKADGEVWFPEDMWRGGNFIELQFSFFLLSKHLQNWSDSAVFF